MNIRVTVRAAGLFVLLAAIVLLSPTPSPTFAELGHFDATSSVTMSSVAPGAARGLTLTMVTPAGDILDVGTGPFSAGPGPIVWEPVGVTVTPGCNKAGYRDFNNDNLIDAGETPCLAQGAAAGTHTWQATLGLSNGPCSTATTVTVDLFNVAMPNNELDPRLSTNIVYPRAQGATNRFGGWQVGSAPAGGTAPLDMDANGRADAGALAVQNYPSYLLDLSDSDGAGSVDPVLPLAVYGGLTQVSGEWWPFYFAQFESGDLPAAFAGLSPHPYERAAAPLGHPLQPVAGDPTATLIGPTTITDICAPSTTTTNLPATVGGVTRAVNPATAGTHMVLVWRATQRDMDNDGYENNIDSCPRIANVEDPRSTAGPDGDMLDSACDPSPGTGAGDSDADGVANALDNCPLVANASQVEGERTYPPGYFAHAFDGGPAADHMGDACETGNTITASGSTLSPAITDLASPTMVYTGADVFAQHDYIQIDSEIMRISDVTNATNTLIVGRGQAGTTAAAHANLAPISDIVGITVTLNGASTPFVFSPTAANGHWHARGDVFPGCYSTAPVDADGDGYCATGTAGCAGACIVDVADSGACAVMVPPNCSVRHNAWTTTLAFAHLLLFDTDRGGGDLSGVSDSGGIGQGISCPGGSADLCPENAFDSDWIETYVGSNPVQACPRNSGLNNEPWDSWQPDFNDDQRANLSDIVALGPSFGKFVNAPGGSIRFDITANGLVDLSDVTSFGLFFSKQCRRTDGTFGQQQ